MHAQFTPSILAAHQSADNMFLSIRTMPRGAQSCVAFMLKQSLGLPTCSVHAMCVIYHVVNAKLLTPSHHISQLPHVLYADPYFLEPTKYQGRPKYMDPSVVNVSPLSETDIRALADTLPARLASYKEKELASPWLMGGELRARYVVHCTALI